MAKRNSAYWKKRMEALEDSQYQRSAEYYRDVQKQFREASNSIQMDIERWYQHLADNNNLSYAGAKKLLSKNELDEFHWSVEQYIKAGEENAVDQRWMKELENASARHHISYLEAMKLQSQQHAELLSAEFDHGMTDFLHQSYGEQYHRNAFEIARGTGVGSNIAQIDSRTIDALIKKPWAQDGKNFSDRIWMNRDKLVNNLHTELTQSIIRGSDPKRAIENLAKTMEVSRAQAGRLIMTESAAISSAAQKECFKDLDVERYEILATLDSHTSDICREMDGKVFDMKDYQVGETAPPFHPHCRSTTIPYFDDEFTEDEERAARDDDTGKTYYVPADMKYEEWEKKFVINENEEQKSKVITKAKINEQYINSLEYRKQFDNLTDNAEVNKTIYECSKNMLKHRNGTMYEDMYFIDKNTGKIIASSTKINKESEVGYNKEIKKALSNYDMSQIIAIHNHPSGMPPSAGDFNAALKNGYYEGYTIGHDGSIIRYRAGKEPIDMESYILRLAIGGKNTYNEYDRQMLVLKEFKDRYGIQYEVISSGKK